MEIVRDEIQPIGFMWCMIDKTGKYSVWIDEKCNVFDYKDKEFKMVGNEARMIPIEMEDGSCVMELKYESL